jgi:hypothetical protein
MPTVNAWNFTIFQESGLQTEEHHKKAWREVLKHTYRQKKKDDGLEGRVASAN